MNYKASKMAPDLNFTGGPKNNALQINSQDLFCRDFSSSNVVQTSLQKQYAKNCQGTCSSWAVHSQNAEKIHDGIYFSLLKCD